MKAKKLLSLFLSVVLLISAFSFSSFAEEKSEIIVNKNAVFIKGYTNRTFKPNNNMTRAEAATIIARLIADENEINGKYETSFDDVSKTDWFYDAVSYLDTLNILSSYEDTFSPNQNITRAEFVELLYKIGNLPSDGEMKFSDVDKTHKMYDAIAASVKTGLVNGYPDGTFKPDGQITRAEVVVVVLRFLGREIPKEGNSSLTDISDHWAKYYIIAATSMDSETKETIKPQLLENTYRKLNTDKKLTIGFLGGSITYGSSATRDIGDVKGDIMLNYVNRTTTWFKETYPDANIATVNAGISDTGSGFGVFRVKDQLMNTDGHDMPDLVFLEFSSNDWPSAGYENIVKSMESLILNIYELNPYAEIVVLHTARSESSSIRLAHNEAANHYGIPIIDLGIPMQKLMTERGFSAESTGNFYYTVDNLHPSVTGYGIYFEQMKQFFIKTMIDTHPEGNAPYNYEENLPAPYKEPLMTNPRYILAENFDEQIGFSKNLAVTSSMYGMNTTASSVVYTPTSIYTTTPDSSFSFKFTGTSFGFLFYLTKAYVDLEYSVDGGEWKNFVINNFQCYEHPQLYILEYSLNKGEHSVKVRIKETTGPEYNGDKTYVRIGAAAVS